MAAQRADALVIFGATGDLAKLETFPALVGLVERGCWISGGRGGQERLGAGQFRDYATASLNSTKGPATAATKMLACCGMDGDLDDDATYRLSQAAGPVTKCHSIWRCKRFVRTDHEEHRQGRQVPGAQVMVEKPFGSDQPSSRS
jgi:glucose-6-phosphate 1-dehydrogenase